MKTVKNLILISIIIFLTSGLLFTGAVADRLFVLKPVDYLVKRANLPSSNEVVTNRILQEESVVVDVAEQVAPSVVTVSIKQERQVVNPFFMDPFGMFGQQFGGKTETIEQDIGSGFVVEGGLVVTNKHVVGNANASYKVVDSNNQEHQVEQIYRDPANDLAILKIDNDNLPAIQLGDSDQLKVGQFVIAIGTALGEFRHTVTTGVISGLGRGINAGDGLGGLVERLDNVIQTDAAINPGNSGGPLLDSLGQVIGINTAVSAQGENIGFAIPINILKTSLTNFEQTGRFDRAFFGVRYQMISREAALMNEVPAGAYIAEVVSGSPADKAGIKAGDIVTKIDNQSLIDNDAGLAGVVGSKKVGDKVSVEYWRDGETVTGSATLSPMQE